MALTQEEIDELLRKEEICFIATVRENGAPHIAPIWFLHVDGKIYFETDMTTNKYQNIRSNNRVAVCFGGRNTLVIEGTVKEYSGEETVPIPFRRMFREKYKEAYDDSYINDKTRFFELVPEKRTSWHYQLNGEYFPDLEC